jgi:uncharacterized protein (DUF169 family)
MNKIHHIFSNHFRSHFIKVKFYKETPKQDHGKRLKNVRFCEAVFEAMHSPVILDKESVNCIGAQYAFGWEDEASFLEHCKGKTAFPSEAMIHSLLHQTPHLEQGFESIGLNTEGDPDLILARVTPKEAMVLIELYNRKTGKALDVDLCGGIAVKTYLENRITFSFGCRDSRKYAKISQDRLVVGIPKSQFDLINDQNGL